MTTGLDRALDSIPTQSNGSGARAFSALVVDDHPLVRESIVARLRAMGARDVAEAATAGEALGRLRAGTPDLLLLDLGLPRVDGLDLLEALSCEPRFVEIPVIVFSGRDEPEAVAAAKRRGACDYIVKGGAWDQTYERIEACLARPADH